MAISGNPNLSAQRWTDPKRVKARVVKAVREAGGNLSAAARSLGITKRTLSRWFEDDRELARACRQAQKEVNGRAR